MSEACVGRALAAALVIGFFVVGAGSLSACRLDSFRFYEVLRTSTEECDILPQGEFCVTPDQLSAPIFEVWSVEVRGDETRIFLDDQVWIAEPPEEDADPDRIVAKKLEVTSREPGPCTTETSGSIDVLANDNGLTGTLRSKIRTEGPSACGDTPRGLRTTSGVAGTIVGAP
jgi:hypothetical protein